MIDGNDRLDFSVVVLLLLLLDEIGSFSWSEWEVVFKTGGAAEGACHCCGRGALGAAAS